MLQKELTRKILLFSNRVRSLGKLMLVALSSLFAFSRKLITPLEVTERWRSGRKGRKMRGEGRKGEKEEGRKKGREQKGKGRREKERGKERKRKGEKKERERGRGRG